VNIQRVAFIHPHKRLITLSLLILSLLILSLLILFLLIAATQATWAQTPAEQVASNEIEAAIEADLAAWQTELEQIAAELEKPQRSENQFERLSTQLDALIARAEHHKAEAASELAGPQAELGALGAEPEQGKAAEADDIAAQRKAIKERIATIDALIKQSELTVTRAEELLSRISDIRSERLSHYLFTRGAPIFSGKVWRAAAAEFETFTTELVIAGKPYWLPEQLTKHWPELLGLALAGGSALGGSWLLGGWVLQE
jgi:small-conductance mechanosensitive channel